MRFSRGASSNDHPALVAEEPEVCVSVWVHCDGIEGITTIVNHNCSFVRPARYCLSVAILLGLEEFLEMRVSRSVQVRGRGSIL